MRIDKYLAELWLVPRRKAKKVFKEEQIIINNEVITDVGYLLKPNDVILFEKKEIVYKPVVVYLLNKPVGYVCSDVPEGKWPSYRDLLGACVYKEILHVAGRLDVDTTGVVILTNDGELNHRIISPKKKLVKIYEVDCEKELINSDIKALEDWVVIENGYKTLPAQVERITDKKILLSIYEGKYHQVKKMIEAVNNTVVKLHRKQIGNCTLGNLKEGERQEIQEEDIWL